MNWKRFFVVAFALLIAVSMDCARLAAQATINTGSIQGVVTDAQGAVVPGAKVSISNKETGQLISTVTSSAGQFSAAALNPGTMWSASRRPILRPPKPRLSFRSDKSPR